ncbi:metallophosphoesterase [Arcobacter sp. LA11]|uniref:metallophosphoesterase family protein n=1 Tax=Arcobacter sp. LA11 TaxID=1898176 RepID=UPI0009321A86|nr:metallophosphoesterase family protein [Arcobacter sp. LA11]
MIKDLGELQAPLLVFGGPYSNFAATKAIKAIADARNITSDRVICTGDLVAYCAQPEETVNLIQDWGCHVVMGNCEESLSANSDDCGCGFDKNSACSLLSIEWYNYANKHVPLSHKKWMGLLPRQLHFSLANKQFHVVHGSVESINEFVFASSDINCKQEQLEQVSSDVIIGGHCGIPFGQELENGYWLNAGVIGMPANDATPDGWYMILDTTVQGIEISWHRLIYDYQASVDAMNEAKMCKPYAKCLIDGNWPSLDVLPTKEREAKKNISLSSMYL